MRMRNSVIAGSALVVFVYTVGMWIWRHQSAVDVQKLVCLGSGRPNASDISRRLVCVCQRAVFQFILLRWYMRFLIWFWFLLRVSRLKLQLLAAHPDRGGWPRLPV